MGVPPGESAKLLGQLLAGRHSRPADQHRHDTDVAPQGGGHLQAGEVVGVVEATLAVRVGSGQPARADDDQHHQGRDDGEQAGAHGSGSPVSAGPPGRRPPEPVADVLHGPDQPRPTFTEDGYAVFNRYRPPAHPAAGGNLAAFDSYFARLIPDETERTWMWHWLAHKARRPWIPMVAVIMVAAMLLGLATAATLYALGIPLVGALWIVTAAALAVVGLLLRSAWRSGRRVIAPWLGSRKS